MKSMENKFIFETSEGGGLVETGCLSMIKRLCLSFGLLIGHGIWKGFPRLGVARKIFTNIIAEKLSF